MKVTYLSRLYVDRIGLRCPVEEVLHGEVYVHDGQTMKYYRNGMRKEVWGSIPQELNATGYFSNGRAAKETSTVTILETNYIP